MPRIARADLGPLAAYADGFRTELAGLGYRPDCVTRKLWEAGELGDWMTVHAVELDELSTARLLEFALVVRDVGERPVRRRAIGPLVGYLRALGVIPAEEVGATPLDQLVEHYRHWLVHDRGLAVRTVDRYVKTARAFLTQRRTGPDTCGIEALSGRAVTDFLLTECTRLAVGSAKGRVAELRSLLRFLAVEGLCPIGLADSIPPVAGWRGTALPPPTLTRAEVGAMLASCDRTSEIGLRDFAILTVLARLGLRAAEVAGLGLDDLDWRAGEVTVRGKGRRDDRLPLPHEVGEALVDYLEQARPSVGPRAVFVTRYAPLRPLAPATVSNVVVTASRRAGLPAPVAAHRLRHTLATDLLASGVALPEISQVLRHRDLATTALYAKVDHRALRTIALSWPGAGQ